MTRITKLVRDLDENVPDAELLAAGEKLDRLVEEHMRSSAFNELLPDIWIGSVPRHYWPNHDSCGNALIAVRRALFEAVQSRDPDDVSNDIFELAVRIRALKATTVAGLAVKAKLARFEFALEYPDGLRHEDAVQDGNYEAISWRMLIDGVLELAAASAPPVDGRARAG